MHLHFSNYGLGHGSNRNTRCVNRALRLMPLKEISVNAFCSLINIAEAPVCHFRDKYWHTFWIFSQMFSFTLRHELCVVSEYSPSRPFFTYFVCIDRLDRTEAQKCTCLLFQERARADTHTFSSAWEQASLVGVDRLSVPILSIFTIIDIGHFSKQICR